MGERLRNNLNPAVSVSPKHRSMSVPGFCRFALQVPFRSMVAVTIVCTSVCCAQSILFEGADTRKATETATVHEEPSPRDLTPGVPGPDDLTDDATVTSGPISSEPWGPVATRDASVANLLPLLLAYFNNGPVFGLPGTEVGDIFHRTQLSGDWGGLRTELARRGYFFDLYTTGAYQDVASGGLKTGGSFIQNNQLSINVDTERARLWPGGLLHITLQSRNGSSPERNFAVGSDVPQYYGLTLPGPFYVHDYLPTEYFLLQPLSPKFSVLLGKITVLNICDQTLFGDRYRYYFANFNFNKNPIALYFYNPTSLTAVAEWAPSRRVILAGGVLDPNSKADNLAKNAFNHVDIYGASIFSYGVVGLPGQAWAQFNWTNKPKIDLGSPFGELSPGQVPQALGVLTGGTATQGLPINYKPYSWVTIGNFSQYLWLREKPEAVGLKLTSGQPLRGVGIFGRAGYAPEATITVARQGSIALLASGLADRRKYDSFGAGFYYNGTSRPLKDDVARLTNGGVTLKNEKGTEIFYDFAVTPAIRLIPSYQHVWDPLSAEVATTSRKADVFLMRMNLAW
jgi:porin